MKKCIDEMIELIRDYLFKQQLDFNELILYIRKDDCKFTVDFQGNRRLLITLEEEDSNILIKGISIININEYMSENLTYFTDTDSFWGNRKTYKLYSTYSDVFITKFSEKVNKNNIIDILNLKFLQYIKTKLYVVKN